MNHAANILGFFDIEKKLKADLNKECVVDELESVLYSLGWFVVDLNVHLLESKTLVVNQITGWEKTEVLLYCHGLS